MNAGEVVGVGIFALIFIAAWLVPIVVCAMKGKWGLAAATFFLYFTFPFAIVGAIRIAKPDSWWAKRNYGPQEMREARERYESRGGGIPLPTGLLPNVTSGTPLGGPLPKASPVPPPAGAPQAQVPPPAPTTAAPSGFSAQPATQHAWLCGVCGQGFNREGQVDDHSYAEHGVRGVATRPLPGA